MFSKHECVLVPFLECSWMHHNSFGEYILYDFWLYVSTEMENNFMQSFPSTFAELHSKRNFWNSIKAFVFVYEPMKKRRKLFQFRIGSKAIWQDIASLSGRYLSRSN